MAASSWGREAILRLHLPYWGNLVPLEQVARWIVAIKLQVYF